VFPRIEGDSREQDVALWPEFPQGSPAFCLPRAENLTVLGLAATIPPVFVHILELNLLISKSVNPGKLYCPKADFREMQEGKYTKIFARISSIFKITVKHKIDWKTLICRALVLANRRVTHFRMNKFI
jgi:hypothetical protein